ncbi:AMP-binding protein [Burkholderia mayonis]|uniref:Siderophore biosynthesis protein n=1 Tax=Burkholderia mayonis TaxID=1385591 RepID=A0A1B4FV18_9BURK|nr:AMP-binding protein [Burkholderia mayonis]AOJ07496.1 siderophore biosynthesis protein [Burkholderia mayonis]KVE56466.1 siderophore biosynthesis protein [Burkholderia mayonis]
MNANVVSLNRRLAAALQAGGAMPALIAGDRVISYRDLTSHVAITAERLNAHGIGKGDRVAFQLPNSADAVVLMLATLMSGAIPVPILPSYRERELRHIVKTTRPRAIALTHGSRRFSPLQTVVGLFAEESLEAGLLLADGPSRADDRPEWLDLRQFCLAPADSMPRELHPIDMRADDTAMMLLSSGTTGLPKAIARRNAGYGYMIAEGCKVFELSRSAVYLAVLPLSHGFVINCPGILGTLACGGTVVLAADASAQTSLALIDAHGVTHTTLVPALLMQWMDRVGDSRAGSGTLRYMQVGGSRLSAELATQAESRLGVRIQQCYGMSEGLLCFTRFADPEAIRFNSQGRPLSEADEILIVDDGGEPVPCGESGELLTRGPYTIEQYFNDPDASRRAFTPSGYYRTGDVAHVDAAGNVYIDGRVTDTINRGGEKFCPEELEALIKRYAKLKDAACVGMPDDRFGEVSCLFAVARDGEQVSLAELRQHLDAAGVAAFKLPEKLVLIDEIPRTGIGKIDRAALRASVGENAQAAAPACRTVQI